MTRVLGIVAAIALPTLCALLPFLPGRYDTLALPLSAMARTSAHASLLLVPMAVGWLVAGAGRGLSVATLIALGLVLLVTSLAASVFGGFTLGGLSLACGTAAVLKMRRTLRRETTSDRVVAAYLGLVPIAALALQYALIGPAVEWSRDRAIRNSAQLIAHVEEHRATQGRYPSSILALWPDYLPGVIGVPQYHYELAGESYNIVFEQPAANLATHELVVYNPRDQQVAFSHAMDRLRYRPLRNGGGFFAAFDTAHPHWKYFWFD